jgi:dTDP-4-amino-4,6-dideoxygalactose transaminase
MIEYENLNKVNLEYKEDLHQIFENFLKDNYYVLGQGLSEFETMFSKYIGVKYTTGVNSGLDALTLAIKALKIEKGMEVIVPANTYIATILSILHNDLIPVLVEPDIDTYNIGIEEVEKKITNKTKIILPVHLYGKACNMDGLNMLCDRYNLYLIEDCAQAHGTEYKGRRVGCFGDISCFSFYPTKNLGCLGDGGGVVTDSFLYNSRLNELRNYGSNVKYKNIQIGFNSRLDEIQALILNEKLKSLNRVIRHKRNLAKIYLDNLDSNKFILPQVHSDYFDTYHIFAIRNENRDGLRNYLLKNNIKTEIHYPIPPYRQKALEHLFEDKEFPISDKIHNTILSLPISTIHTEDDIFRVVEVMNKF